MAFMALALAGIGIGIAVMIGYLLVAQVMTTMPTGAAGSAVDNVSIAANKSMTTVFAGFGIITVGIIVMAGFGIVAIFK